MKNAVRQGDVLIVPCDSIPATASIALHEAGRLIVARGEATGHHHSFPWLNGPTLFRDNSAGSGGSQYVAVQKPTLLEHQEHTALKVAAGTYAVIIQRTFTNGIVRRVKD